MRILKDPWHWAVLAWIGTIFFSSTSLAAKWCEEAFRFVTGLFPGGLGPRGPYYELVHLLADKGLHVTLFLVLAVLLWNSIPQGRWKIEEILVCGAFVGSCSEFLQRFFPGRDPAIRDVLINVGGTALGVLVSVAFVRFHRANARDRLSGAEDATELARKR